MQLSWAAAAAACWAILFEVTCAWCMKALIVAWYSVGAVCIESGVESLGGVGGNENRC